MTMPLRTGEPTRLGDYELEGRLGSGGMGTVYLGRARDGRRVAIKAIRHDLSWDDELRGRFRSEVNRVRQVPPFSTAAVLDADPDHDPPYLVVEYVDGPSLAQVVRDDGPLNPDALHSMAIGITTALVAIHGAGVIHRDLKPGNVLFALGGVKVIDFGIARPLEVTSQHTRTDQMVGTVAYMAPERFDTDNAGPVTPAADVFAWGVVVMFAATGRTPFGGESAPATAMRILTQEPDLTGLTGPLRTLVARALAKRPADRPTARDLLDALLAATAPAPPRVDPVAMPAGWTDTPAPRAQTAPPQQPWTPPSQRRPDRPAQNVQHQPPAFQPPQRWTAPQGRPVPDRLVPGYSGAVPAKKRRKHSRAFVALMVATGLLGTVLTSVVFLHLDSATSSYSGDSGGEAAPILYEAATPAAMAELVTRLLPEHELSHLRGSDPLELLFYLDSGEGQGMVTLSVSGKRKTPVRDGAPKVAVATNAKNCVQDRTVKATWPDGTIVQADVATCLAWDGSRNEPADPALTSDEAKALVTDPQWGMMMDSELVAAGAANYPDLV